MSISQALNVLSTYTSQLTSMERNQLNCAIRFHERHNTLRIAHLNALLCMAERLMFDTQGKQVSILDMTYLFAEVKGDMLTSNL